MVFSVIMISERQYDVSGVTLNPGNNLSGNGFLSRLIATNTLSHNWVHCLSCPVVIYVQSHRCRCPCSCSRNNHCKHIEYNTYIKNSRFITRTQAATSLEIVLTTCRKRDVSRSLHYYGGYYLFKHAFETKLDQPIPFYLARGRHLGRRLVR